MTGAEGWQQAADRLAAEAFAEGRPKAWYERLYSAAQRGETTTPWDRRSPYPPFADWAASAGLDGRGKRAVVVGCGLGADAAHAASLGYSTTAFDIAPSAVAEAGGRFPDAGVDFRVVDLFDLPADWIGAFDLVVEIFTVQSMPPELHATAARAVASLVGPGGYLVAIGAVADGDAITDDGPPFPLTSAEIRGFAQPGLREVAFDRVTVGDAPRWRLVLDADQA